MLKRGTSKKVFRENVSEMVRSGHPIAQALAAAYDNQRRSQHNRPRRKK